MSKSPTREGDDPYFLMGVGKYPPSRSFPDIAIGEIPLESA
jgi:hypothetical protein